MKMWKWEQKKAPKIPVLQVPSMVQAKSLPSGSKVVVVGGGIAGSSFARQLLKFSQLAGKKFEVYLINSSNCNYCGGLVTQLAEKTLGSLYDLDIRSDLVLKKVEHAVYLNNSGAVEVRLPFQLTTLLRTSRFGYEGFDDNVKERITEGLNGEDLQVFEPTLVRHIERSSQGPHRWLVTLSKQDPNGQPVQLQADFLVIATGFRSLGRPMMEQFQEVSGYMPPPTMEASVTEIDTSKARYNSIGTKIYILDGILDDCVLAFIPKGPDWLTLTVLGRKLKKEDLTAVFDHPSVKRFIDLPEADKSPRCHTVCPAKVFTGISANFYGDGWVAIGDLNGYSRVLKDGYFGAFMSGYLAARTIAFFGSDKSSLAKHYHSALRRFKTDNRFGIGLFRINLRLNRKRWFSRFFIWAAGSEIQHDSYGREIHAAIRGLTTGEVAYCWISWLFIKGLLIQLLRHPLSAAKAFVGFEGESISNNKNLSG